VPPRTRTRRRSSARYKPVPDGSGGVHYAPDCRQTIHFETLGKRVADFGVPIDKAALNDLNRSPLTPENVDPDYSGLCAYCGNLLSKDD
jgi:hypothetical protein